MAAKNKQQDIIGNTVNVLKKDLQRKRPKKVPEVMETIQASIPIFTVHEKRNLIETYKDCFTRSYSIDNINYQTASEAE